MPIPGDVKRDGTPLAFAMTYAKRSQFVGSSCILFASEKDYPDGYGDYLFC
jgi:hypothetical protein